MGKRQQYAGLVAAMDEAVGNVTRAFKEKDSHGAFWKNTLLVFSTDNGGIGHGNNYPLRSGKGSLFEGGTRGVAFIHGYGLKKTGYSSDQMMHVVDWLPTLLHESLEKLPKKLQEQISDVDGLDMWDALTNDQSSPRTEFVYNIVPQGMHTKHIAHGAVRSGCFKLMVGTHRDTGYASSPELLGINSSFDFDNDSSDDALYSEDDADLFGGQVEGPFLYNVCTDPEERHDLYNKTKVSQQQTRLEALLETYRRDMVPSLTNTVKKAEDHDWLMNGTWTTWGCKVHREQRRRRNSKSHSNFLGTHMSLSVQ
jgi:arylsulfatase A-like enzyme